MKCPQCEKEFGSAEAVVRHRQGVHHNISHPCKCKVCGEVFQTWKERRQHVKENHESKDGESQVQASQTIGEAEVQDLRRDVYEPQTAA